MSTSPTPMTKGMRRMLFTASFLVLTIGLRLIFFPGHTEDSFPWTISVPMTAAFMGAAYFSTFFLEYMASRQDNWVNGRIAVPAVLIFTVITLWVTLVHINLFHLGDQHTLISQVITWFWLLIYISVPIIMGGLLFRQLRVKGTKSVRTMPMPIAARGIFVIYSLILIPFGLLFLISPDSAKGAWPWLLTPLTARVIGAWMVGLGTLTAHTAIEADWKRVLPVMPTLAIGAGLEIVMALLYSSFLDWSSSATLLYVGILGTMVLVGVYGTLKGSRVSQSSRVLAQQS